MNKKRPPFVQPPICAPPSAPSAAVPSPDRCDPPCPRRRGRSPATPATRNAGISMAISMAEMLNNEVTRVMKVTIVVEVMKVTRGRKVRGD